MVVIATLPLLGIRPRRANARWGTEEKREASDLPDDDVDDDKEAAPLFETSTLSVR
jgi:hypothetical protein